MISESAIGLGECGAASRTPSCVAILSSSDRLTREMGKLMFKERKAWVEKVRKWGLACLNHPLSAACQPACPFTDPPDHPSHLTQDLRWEPSPGKLAAPWLPGAMALGARVSDSKDQLDPWSRGNGGAGADVGLRQWLHRPHRGVIIRAGDFLCQEFLLRLLNSNTEPITSSPAGADLPKLFRELSHPWPHSSPWEAPEWG